MSKAVDERAERGDLIDNCLISRGLTVLEQAHGPDVGSDTFPDHPLWAIRGDSGPVMI
jgi:hypothetical protein